MSKSTNVNNIVPQSDPNVKTFSDLLTNYAHHATVDSTTDEYATALTDLATAVAYSVLKKCINTGYNDTLVSIRNDLTIGRITLNNTAYTADHATDLTFNADGDLETVTVDRDSATALTVLCRETLGDGLDLVNTAVVAILEETEKQRDRCELINLESPYEVRQLKRKVWIKAPESNAWETVQTVPIKEVFRAVRRSIMDSKAMQTDPRNGYSYLEDLTYDPDTGDSTTIYRRLTRYADLGGYVTDFNGACTLYTVDRETVDRYDQLIASLNLTAKQAKCLKLREQGYGNKAIATALGVTENSVKGAMTEIRRKAKQIGLDPGAFAPAK